jgi:hypothetical protein
MNSWSSKEWKEKRQKRIANHLCQQCGKQTTLQVHHNKTDQNLYKLMERRIIRALIHEKMDSGKIPFRGKTIRILTCPLCHGKNQIFNPRYKNYTCQKCGEKSTLNSLNTETVRKPNYKLGRQEIKFFIRRYRKEIDSILKQKGAPPKPDYMNLNQDTVILCKVCHYALENGFDLCSICHLQYKKVQELMCSTCINQNSDAKHLIRE